jgi:hypothetical protein
VPPSESVLKEAASRQQDLLVVPVAVCVAADGTVTTAELTGTSGFPCYDEQVLSTVMRSTFSVFSRAPDGCGKVTISWDAKAARDGH